VAAVSARDLRAAIVEKLYCMQARFPEVATAHDYYLALAYAVRDLLLHKWIDTAYTYFLRESRTVVYLSAEYLLGPQLGSNLVNLGIMDEAREAVASLGLDLDELLDEEEEPGLGNGGLGRLAACYMDSLATLAIPAIGYGIRYEFGIFEQAIENGGQVERTDKWLRLGNPWEIARPEVRFDVRLGGRTKTSADREGGWRVEWVPDRLVKGVPYDTPVVGYDVRNVNLLRLWKAEAVESFDVAAFNVGDYYRAVDAKVTSENLTKVLYPNDEPAGGKILRLEQQYFFVSCSLQDLIRMHLQRQQTLDGFHRKWIVQLNDTHPALAVAELMRLFVDEHRMPWESAWDITRQTFAYTNHTLLPEALEAWPVALLARVLPRHLEIIYEINRRFLDEVDGRWPGDGERRRRLSLIQESPDRRVRMAHLACAGSRAINGVAALHTELLRTTVLRDFHDLWPERFSNKTNGVTPRRFLMLANPLLTKLVRDAIGHGWMRDLEELRRLEPLAGDAAFRAEWRRVKRSNKERLADAVAAAAGVVVSPDSLFDVQAKRIHEYKRQHLNLLHVISLYARLVGDNRSVDPPRTFVFAGKAAPGYTMAKLIVRLIAGVARTVNNDPRVNGRLRVVLFPNFNVKNGQRMYPAADLAEQISTAGKEASGTGNMKFAMNGALTIGTLDGANIEIREAVGAENFFLFGLDEREVATRRRDGYRPADEIVRDDELREAIEMIAGGVFSRGDGDAFAPLVDSLVERDEYMVLADYRAYLDCQARAGRAYLDDQQWTRMSILNVARIGRFSSDRAVREYCRDIWHVEPVEVVTSVSEA